MPSMCILYNFTRFKRFSSIINALSELGYVMNLLRHRELDVCQLSGYYEGNKASTYSIPNLINSRDNNGKGHRQANYSYNKLLNCQRIESRPYITTRTVNEFQGYDSYALKTSDKHIRTSCTIIIRALSS